MRARKRIKYLRQKELSQSVAWSAFGEDTITIKHQTLTICLPGGAAAAFLHVSSSREAKPYCGASSQVN